MSDVTEISAEQTYRLRRFVDVRYGYGLGRNRSTFAAGRLRSDRQGGAADHERARGPPQRSVRSGARLVHVGKPRAFAAGTRLGPQLPQELPAVFPVRPDSRQASFSRRPPASAWRGHSETRTLIPSERFFAGGATSVRGYRQDDLGPRSIFGDASGGRALFIANSELRFPIYRWLRGVGFVDLGNVYPTVGDITLPNLQIGAGAGIRLNTPIGLLRLDVAVPANPRPIRSEVDRALRPRPRVLSGLDAPTCLARCA